MLFSRKKQSNPDPLTTLPVHKAAVEIVTDKQAKKEVVQKAKEANKVLNDLLVDNGFTLKIYLAAGGKQHNRRSTNNG